MAIILVAGVALAGIAALAVPIVSVPAAQSPLPVANKQASAPDTNTHPLWSELTVQQKNALAPLAEEWNKIEPFRKKKWLEIGNRFANMSIDEQSRVQEKMREWAKLTPEERRVAREIYTRTKKLDASQKSAQWQEYQQLPEDEKKKLAADIAAKKRVANLPSTPASNKPMSKPFEKAVTEKAIVAPASETAPLASPSSVVVPAPVMPAPSTGSPTLPTPSTPPRQP